MRPSNWSHSNSPDDVTQVWGEARPGVFPPAFRAAAATLDTGAGVTSPGIPLEKLKGTEACHKLDLAGMHWYLQTRSYC